MRQAQQPRGLSILSEHYHVDVESVRFTDAKIGTTTDADLITLADDAVAVAGTLTVSDDLKLPEDAAKITHTAAAGATSAGLSITSTNYHVDVESVRFTDAKIGTTTDADLITLADDSVSIKGTLDTTGYIKVASTKFTVDATGNTYADGTLGVKGVSTLQDDLLLSEDAAVIKHSVAAGSTTAGLSILSEHYHVDVESVRFTDNTIDIALDPDLLSLANAALTVSGTLTVSDDLKLSEDAAKDDSHSCEQRSKRGTGDLKHERPC